MFAVVIEQRDEELLGGGASQDGELPRQLIGAVGDELTHERVVAARLERRGRWVARSTVKRCEVDRLET